MFFKHVLPCLLQFSNCCSICFIISFCMELTPWKESYDQTREHIKSRDIILPTKVRVVKAMVFQGSCMDVRVGL